MLAVAKIVFFPDIRKGIKKIVAQGHYFLFMGLGVYKLIVYEGCKDAACYINGNDYGRSRSEEAVPRSARQNGGRGKGRRKNAGSRRLEAAEAKRSRTGGRGKYYFPKSKGEPPQRGGDTVKKAFGHPFRKTL